MDDDESFEDSPLHEAVRYGNIDEVQALLDEGADPNAIGFYRWSCLHEAVSIDDADILKLLLTTGGDPNVCDRCNGSTPLHHAAKQAATLCFKLLIEWGGDINLPNKELATPQDYATGACAELLQQLEMSAVQASKESDTKHRVLKGGEVRRRKQLQSLGVVAGTNRASSFSDLTGPPVSSSASYSRKAPRAASPSASLRSQRSNTSVKSLDSVLTTQSNPVRGPKGHRTSRKPTVSNMHFANKAPGIRISVEYSEQLKQLKIRVWSVQYVTLLPNFYSPESTLHVRACLFPGSKVWSKTEDVLIDKYLPSQDAERGSLEHIIDTNQPATLQPIPLERKITFKNVPESELGERNIELVLCTKTPQLLTNKQCNVAKLFLRCDEASNLVMPKWYLMTVCSAETKPKPKKSKPPRKPVSFSNPTFENSKLVLESDNSKDMRAHNPLKSHSVVTISKIQISEPLPYTPPTTQIQISKPKRPLPPQINNLKISEPISSDPPPVNNLASSIPNFKNPFRKGEGKERTLVKDRRFDGDKLVLDTRISIPMIEMKNDDRESTLTENMASSSPSRFLKDNKSSRLLKECV